MDNEDADPEVPMSPSKFDPPAATRSVGVCAGDDERQDPSHSYHRHRFLVASAAIDQNFSRQVGEPLDPGRSRESGVIHG
jgi:hypothetical protein